MKILTAFIVSTSLALSAHADVGLKFNFKGEFVPPDKILLDRGIEYYKDGYKEKSRSHFKRSAQFGNNMSKYLVAMQYFEEKDWPTAHAWLTLINNPIEQSDKILLRLNKTLTRQELSLAQQKFEQLHQKYSDHAIYQRRQQWQKSIKFTGSHIPGFKTLDHKNVNVSPGDHVGHLVKAGKTNNFGFTNVRFNSQVLAHRSSIYQYMNEYLPTGEVHLGEIKEKVE